MNQTIKRLLCGFLCACLLMGLFVSFGSMEVSAETVDDVPYTNYTYWENGGTYQLSNLQYDILFPDDESGCRVLGTGYEDGR